MSLEEERDAFRREAQAYSEMLFAVLKETGPVTVKKETLSNQTADDRQIKIDEAEDAFVFSVEVAE
jgi:hypothetical protein